MRQKHLGRDEVEKIFSSYNLEDYLLQSQIQIIKNAGLWTKEKLAKKIVNHYYIYEIGFETYGLFKQQALEYMEEIMEYYLPMIYVNSIEYDPLVNVDFTEEFSRTQQGDSSSNISSSSNSTNNSDLTNINSNTPNVGLDNIKSGKYASEASYSDSNANITDNSNSNSNSIANSTENYIKKTVGNSGVLSTNQAMIKQYRDIVRAIDSEIIEKLDILFMKIY